MKKKKHEGYSNHLRSEQKSISECADLELDKLQQQNGTLVSIPVSQEQESEATTSIGSLKLED